MKDNIHKIVVLTDLNSSIKTTLKSAVSLAKMIGGRIEMFSVMKPTDIIGGDNQLSSMRAINDKHTKLDKKMKRLTDPISKEFDVDIQYSFAFGNIKNELNDYIKASQPDIIVLGKRKPGAFKLIGDSITQFVLNTFDGVVMIAADKNALEPNKELSLGVMNSLESSVQIKFADALLEHTKVPVKLFKIVKNASISEKTESSPNTQTIDYVFEDNDNALKSISNYLIKSKVNILCYERKQKDGIKSTHNTPLDINSMINSINVSLLVGSR